MEKEKFLDQAGLEYLWSKISIKDYPNNETLIAVLNAIDETKADKFTVGEGLQMDEGVLGVKESKYELVNTIEYVEEGQSVVVDTTDDGREWYFSEVFLEIKLNGNNLSELRNLNTWGYPGFKEQICTYGVTTGSSGQKAQMRLYAESGVWNAECSSMSANEIRPATHFWRGFNLNKTTERLPAISGISASNWPVGTVLRIWGVWGKDA